MIYISCFSDFAFYFYYYFMENCHTWIIISKWQNDLHTNTSRSVWPILYGLMIKMLQYKMYPAGELAVLRQLLFFFLMPWLEKVFDSRTSLFGLIYFCTMLKHNSQICVSRYIDKKNQKNPKKTAPHIFSISFVVNTGWTLKFSLSLCFTSQ